MNPATVYIVDDDAAVRDGLSLLVETGGLRPEAYASAEAFLASCNDRRPACLLVDMRMAGMSGLDLQAELTRRGLELPVIFMTAHADVPTSVQAMKGGAMDFLLKPVDAAALLQRVHQAIARNEEDLAKATLRDAQRARLALLTEREREVLALAVAGHSNKDIARRLGISYRTVEVHRSRILSKTGAASLIELAQLTAAADERTPREP